MTRRGAYLLVWGVAYAALGILLVEISGQNVLWKIGLVGAGLIVVLTSVYRVHWTDALGFTTLSVVASLRALAYVLVVFEGESSINFLGTALWLAVALSHIIVSGWPDNEANGKLPQSEGTENRGVG